MPGFVVNTQIPNGQELVEEDAELKELLNSAFEDLISPKIATVIKEGNSNTDSQPEKTISDKPGPSAASNNSASSSTSKVSNNKKKKSKQQQNKQQSQPQSKPKPSSNSFEEDIQKFTEALGSTLKCDNNEFDKFLEDPEKIEQMFQDALKNISGAANDDMQKLIGNLNKGPCNPNDGPAEANINESMPQIFNLVQNLLSKELLYPALKDLAPKFDEWMEKNKNKLSNEDTERYNGQIKLINQICQIFEDDTLHDQERFERNLDLMDKMQSLGAPPPELSVPSDLDNLMMNSVKDKCCIM